jgi:branched-subunit amino acid aminotransferase/4-amino-4-deoxychorismate lyase
MPGDLNQADEVFITSTTRDLLPVTEIEGVILSRRGDACARLRSALRLYIEEYCSLKPVSR